jgi:hypothetical protein
MRWYDVPRFSQDRRITIFATVDGPKDPVMTQRIPVSVLLKIDDNAAGAIIDVGRE